jgi:amino acid transporter
MKKNMGTIDQSIRLALAAVIAILYVTGTVSGAAGIILIVIALIFAVTSFIGFCPLYTLLKISTCKVK